MMPGEVDEGTLTGLVWVMGIGIVPVLVIAWCFTLKVSMTENSYMTCPLERVQL
jgi:hypothetical protein